MSGMNKSGVPWADYTWNPIEGCSPASEGCAHCYAATFAKRFHRPWGAPVAHDWKLSEPCNTRKPGRVFVCSTSDFFHESMNGDFQSGMTLEMAQDQRHTFILLTKRPQNIRRWMDRCIGDGLWPLPNVWLGVTAENQARYDERWPILASIPAFVRFVSVEPELSPVSIIDWACVGLPDWVIAGRENGSGARPCDMFGHLTLAKDCTECHIPFFDKHDPSEPTFTRREFPAPRK